MSDTRDALSDLVKQPGWALFVQHCQEEWGLHGTRYHAELDKALNLTDSDAAHAQALQVRSARVMMEALIGWPAQEVSRLGRVEDPEGHRIAMLSRGGYNR